MSTKDSPSKSIGQFGSRDGGSVVSGRKRLHKATLGADGDPKGIDLSDVLSVGDDSETLATANSSARPTNAVTGN